MDLAGKTIAVTGATGFLGRYIVKVLMDRGASVVGVVRTPDRVPSLIEAGVTMRKADLGDRAALAAGFAGADALVSNAALFSLGNRSWDDHLNTNIQGTENVMNAAHDAGITRVVHVSSIAGYAGYDTPTTGEDHVKLTMETPRKKTNVYSISKAVSEQAAWRLAEEHGIKLTCVRPCAIYGAFDPNFTRIVKRVARWWVTMVPSFTRIQFVYGGDVAEGIALALEKPDVSIGRAYNLCGDDHSVWEFFNAWGRAGGRLTPLRVPLPVPIRRHFDISRAQSELGWSNRPHDECLRETLALEAADA